MTDPADTKLVASVLESDRRRRDDEAFGPKEDEELEEGFAPGIAAPEEFGIEVPIEEDKAAPIIEEPEPAEVDSEELEEPTPQELEALSADMIGIDDPVRMYLKEIGKVALLNAQEEVVLAKSIELGEQTAAEPEKALLSLWEWTKNETEKKTRTAQRQHQLPYGPEADRIVREAFREATEAGLLEQVPDYHFTGAQRAAEGDVAKGFLRRSPRLSSRRPQRRRPPRRPSRSRLARSPSPRSRLPDRQSRWLRLRRPRRRRSSPRLSRRPVTSRRRTPTSLTSPGGLCTPAISRRATTRRCGTCTTGVARPAGATCARGSTGAGTRAPSTACPSRAPTPSS